MPNITLTKIDNDLSFQIVNNSEITLGKFRIFNFAGWITILGFVSAIAIILLISINN
jgi:hypothetical protein